jgi:hypothetical protein
MLPHSVLTDELQKHARGKDGYDQAVCVHYADAPRTAKLFGGFHDDDPSSATAAIEAGIFSSPDARIR